MTNEPIRRYTLDYEDVQPDPNGNWVTIFDHVAAVEAARAAANAPASSVAHGGGVPTEPATNEQLANEHWNGVGGPMSSEHGFDPIEIIDAVGDEMGWAKEALYSQYESMSGYERENLAKAVVAVIAPSVLAGALERVDELWCRYLNPEPDPSRPMFTGRTVGDAIDAPLRAPVTPAEPATTNEPPCVHKWSKPEWCGNHIGRRRCGKCGAFSEAASPPTEGGDE
ncbi:MAG: hypothetical protein PSX37_01880 [bacterium]|nr:hypothetical protein [bacterium]